MQGRERVGLHTKPSSWKQFCDCNKKKALCERPSRILCAVSFHYYCSCCCFCFQFVDEFCYLIVDVMIYLNAKTTWKEKKLEHAIYLGWSPFELPPRTTQISGKTWNKEWHVQVVVHFLFLFLPFLKPNFITRTFQRTFLPGFPLFCKMLRRQIQNL